MQYAGFLCQVHILMSNNKKSAPVVCETGENSCVPGPENFLPRRKTGGGQNPVAELTDFEQQALEVFGIAAVEGHSTSRLGFQNANNAENVPRTAQELLVEIPLPAFPEDPNEFASFCLVVSESLSRTSSRPVTPNPVPRNPAASNCAAPSPNTSRQVLLPTSRNRRGARDEILELVQQDMRNRRHDQSRLAESLENLGNGLMSLAAAIQEMVALQRQHRDYARMMSANML
ncbi:uncharacterized protein [Eurosta solidaginis]|uniref:uncharacterized protein isoform X1 n=1 Tax=Eurosta solidaginis TaxID=178769 RepID=UPI003530E1AD